MRNRILYGLIMFIAFTMTLTSCNKIKNKEVVEQLTNGNFGSDLQFLQKYDSELVVLSSEDKKSQIIVSPKYQSKVFTSTADGDNGKSFGWVNYKAFDGEPSKQMNAYGGENRLWLGPEGNVFSLFFNPKDKMEFPLWRTPAALDSESWTVVSKSNIEASLQKSMNITNYHGTKLSIIIDRKVQLLRKNDIVAELGTVFSDSVSSVGYQTTNKMTNNGQFEWTKDTGMPCIWLLDMFPASDNTVIIIPFKKTPENLFVDVATTNYFGEIPPDRLKHTDTAIFFKADGKHRSKLGVKPEKVLPFAGSYDTVNKVLTIIKFDTNSTEKYLNQEWNTNKPAFSGDAMNAYNDGPVEDGNQMGPFYELESVSPAAFLKPGGSISHKHSVFHFTGNETELSIITEKVFGLKIIDIKSVFKNTL